MSTTRDGSGLRKRQRGFAAVPNETVWDEELANRDLGILTKIIALPEDWDLSTEWLVKKCSEGRDAVMTSLRNLRRLGYYRVERRRRPDGTFVSGVSVSDVRVPEWAAQHAEQAREQGTERPKWDVSLRLLADGRVEDEPARGPVDTPGDVTDSEMPDTVTATGKSVTGQPPTGHPVSGPGDVKTQTETQTQTQTPHPPGGAPAADASPQLALVDAPAQPAKARRERHKLPEDWRPSPELLAKARAKAPGVDVEAEARNFYGYHRSTGDRKIDWDLAFLSTWMGRASQPPGRGRRQPYRNPQTETGQASARAAWESWGHTGGDR